MRMYRREGIWAALLAILCMSALLGPWVLAHDGDGRGVYVSELLLVSSKPASSTETDFTYRIRVVNRGGVIKNASAYAESKSSYTRILDNEVELGTIAAGAALTSTDTFTFRQKKSRTFRSTDIEWDIDGDPVNTPPVARAGPDQTVRVKDKVWLDGTASTDAEGNRLTYRWVMVSKPAGSRASLSSATEARPSFTADRAGDWVFRLYVKDQQSESAPDDVRISTNNSAPIADAGPDRTVPRGALVTLEASRSSDCDRDALSYKWTIASAPTGSTAVLVGATTYRPTIRLDKAGSYTFRLTVSDGRLASKPDEVTISTVNSAPVANAGADQAALPGVPVTLDGSASSDADNDPLSMTWQWQSFPAGSAALLAPVNEVRSKFTPDVAGLYVAQLIVNDGFGNSTPDTIAVTVAALPPPPVSRAPVAVNDSASTTAGTAITIDVLTNDSDPDAGTTLSISNFTQPVSGGAVTAVAGGLRFTPASGFSGNASFTYTVSDGQLTATATVAVSVTAVVATNQPPLVTAGADQTLNRAYDQAEATTTLAGTATDDGNPLPAHLTVGWSKVSGPGTVTFGTPASAASSATFSALGTYVLRLSAGDGVLSTTDDLQVIVQVPTNTGPTLNAIADRTQGVGISLSLQLIANDNDPFDTLTFTLGAAPAGVTLSAQGRLSWTPTVAQLGVNNVSVEVRDAIGLGDTKTFRVTVVAQNRAPTLAALSDDTTSVGAAYSKGLSGSDPDGDALAFDLVSGPAGMTLSGTAVSWQPTAAQTGEHSVTVRVHDPAGAFGVGLFSITVGTVVGPIAREDSYKVTVGQTTTIPAPGVLTNDVSPNGTPLAAIKRSDPAVGTLSAFNADGSLVYTAPATDPKPPFAIVGRRIANTEALPQSAGVTPLLSDLDRDGRPDLVYFSFSGPTLVATALSGGDGHTLWTGIGGLDANACENNLAYASPGHALGDIDDDGQVELITIAGCRNVDSYDRIRAYRSDGSIKWLSAQASKPFFDVYCSVGGCPVGATPTRVIYPLLFDASLSLARLAPGEAPVILSRQEIPATAAEVYTELSPGNLGYKYYGCRIATGDAADMGQACNVTLIISTVDGSVQQVLRSPLRPQFNRGIPISPYQRNPPITADLDGDGSVEIISGADVWRRVDGTWTLAWQSAAEPEQVAVADLDGDGRPEIIHALDRYQNLAPGTPYLGFEGILIFDANGQELRRIRLPSQFPGLLTIADIDGDRVPELLIPEAGNVHAIGTDGSFKWTYAVPDHAVYPVPSSLRTTYKNNIVVYDLDGDGNNEVIFSSSTGLHILDGRSGAVKAFFDGGTRYGGLHAPNATYVTDWDNDGHADIISFAPVPPSLATESFAYIITATNNDWLPAEKIHNQVAFQPSGVDEAGRVLFDPSVSRSYRNPRQLGTVRDPRATAGTSFDYAVNDGATDSAVAKVFLEIAPQNSPPVFTSRPPSAIQAQEPSPYVYQATAVDPDQGDTVTYSLTAFGSNGLTGPSIYVDVNPSTGAVSITRSAGFGAFDLRITITATDSQGATAFQSFVLRHENQPPVAVPNVVGSLLTQAAQTLSAALLQSTVLQEQYSGQPAGTVIAQSPLATSSQPLGTTVLLTVSKGPAPAVVPTTVGRFEAGAVSLLTGAGFTPAITRQFSSTIERGVVISQSPAAGTEVPPGTATIVISAGAGLELALARTVTPANQPISYTVIARDLNGTVIAAPAVTLTVAPLTATSGATPSANTTTITPAADSRGQFRLEVSDGARVISADFVVTQPSTAAKRSQLELFAQLDSALTTMDNLLGEANAARLAGDTTTMRSKMVSWVNTWRAIDIDALKLASPVAPEIGFPPDVEDMAAFGVVQTAADALNKTILRDAANDLLDIEAALVEPTTPYQQVVSLFKTFNARAERIRSVTPGEYSAADCKSVYAVILAHRIPRVMEALVNDTAQTLGMTARQPRYPALASAGAPGAGNSPNLWTRSPETSLASLDSRAGGGEAYLYSTLAEQLTTLAVQQITEAIGGGYTIKKFYVDATKNALIGGAIIAIAHHVKAVTNGREMTVTTGASLSFNNFYVPYSTIEGIGLNGTDPEVNQLMVIGPDVFNKMKAVLDGIKDGVGLVTATVAPEKWKSLEDKFEALLNFKDEADKQLDLAITGAPQVVEVFQNVYQSPSPIAEVSDCIFESGPLCRSIQYRSGFRTTYKPLVLSLPSPVAFISVNTTTGEVLVTAANFFPHN